MTLARAVTAAVFAALAASAAARADEDADLKAFAGSVKAGYYNPAPARDPGPLLKLDEATDDDLVRLAALAPKKLKTLDLSFCIKVTDRGFASLGKLPSVTQLWLPCGLSDKAYASLADQTPNLESLLVKGYGKHLSKLTDAGIPPLGKLTKLKSVILIGVPVTDESWPAFAAIPSLTELGINDGSIKGRGINQLAACPKLTDLTLRLCEVSEKGFKEVSELQSLTALTLDESGVRDGGLEHIAKLKGLRSLSIENEKLTDAALASVAKLDALQTLYVMKVPFTDRGIQQLAALKKLKEIRLNVTRVTPGGIEQLRTRLPGADIKKNK